MLEISNLDPVKMGVSKMGCLSSEALAQVGLSFEALRVGGCPYFSFFREYKDKGLVVLGFNCADDKQIALNFLKENFISFSNIVDSSDAANKTYYEDYQKLKGRSAVPLTYIIDRDGKVAGAFYGYEEDDKRGIGVLEKLGIK